MNAELTNTRKRTRLDRKFDRLRDAEEAGKLGKSKTSRAVRKMLENRLAVIGLVVFAIILISCLLAPLISPYDPLTTDLRAMTQPPSLQHLFGTDKLGRDVFSRTLYGGRLSILIGLGSALGAAVIGVLLGCYGGYKGGLFDKIRAAPVQDFYVLPATDSGDDAGHHLWPGPLEPDLYLYSYRLGRRLPTGTSENALLAGGGVCAVHAGLWPK